MATLLLVNLQDKVDLEAIREEIAANPKVEGGASTIQSGDVSVKLLGRSADDLYELCDKIMNSLL